MRPYKAGQIARFHTPFPDEDPRQLYVVLAVMEDDELPRAWIRVLNTGQLFDPINTVSLNDLEIAEVSTSDLIGRRASVRKDDDSIVSGVVLETEKQALVPDLEKGKDGVETNVVITIMDSQCNKHTGTLFVK